MNEPTPDRREILIGFTFNKETREYVINARYDGNTEEDAIISCWSGPNDDQLELLDYITRHLHDLLTKIVEQKENESAAQ